MEKLQPDPGKNADGDTVYGARAIKKRPAAQFTARIIPDYEGIGVPLEDNHILWQR